MYRLHGQDASWLYRETLTTPMHTLKIFLVKLAPDQQLDFQAVRESVPRLLHEVPMLRQRPVPVPLGLHHPVMIEDPQFDLDYHLNRAALPAPGGMRELEEVIAHIATHPLDQNRPLWQFWVIDGLADGRIALVQKIHHALADGMASVNFIMRVWQSGYHDPESTVTPWQPEPLPTAPRLVWEALKDHLTRDIVRLPDFIKAVYRGTWAIKRQAMADDSPAVKSLTGDLPRTRWNRALSSRRSFATTQISLQEMKALKEQLGGTLNDAVLSLVAGSIREFLIGHNELPEEALLVTVPVSRDESGTGRESGNSTAVMTTLLHVEIPDPLRRHEAIRQATGRGKADLDIVGRDTFSLMSHYVPPALQQRTALRGYRKQLADRPGFKPPANLSVSNVPGPREKFSALGNVVEDLYSAGPLDEGMGLNITVWSYGGNMNFTLVGCMKALPDIDRIAAGLKTTMVQLQAASPVSAAPADSNLGYKSPDSEIKFEKVSSST